MKYIIDLPDKVNWIQYIQQRCHGTRNLKVEYVCDLTPYIEPDNKAIEDEVWQTAIEIDRNTDNYDWQDMTYQEAKANYESWKKEKDEIRVGDEVLDFLGEPYIIYEITDVSAYGIRFDGYPLSHQCFPICYNKKTGRHFDEVEELLKKIRRNK